MPRLASLLRLVPTGRAPRTRVTAHHALAGELSDHATDADRNDLHLLAEAAGPGGGEVTAILGRQAGVRLFRAA